MESSILFNPEINDRALDRQARKIDSRLQESGEISPQISGGVGQMGGIAGGPGMGAEAGGMGGRLGGIQDRLGGIGRTLSSKLPGTMAGVSASATMPVALAGAAGVGMLAAMHSSSARLQAVTGMLGTATNLFFRPFGNFLGEQLRPFAKGGIEMASNFNKIASSKGLAVGVEYLAGTALRGLGSTINSAIGLDTQDAGDLITGTVSAAGLIVGGVKLTSLVSSVGVTTLLTGGISAGVLITGTVAASSLIVGTVAARSVIEGEIGARDVVVGTIGAGALVTGALKVGGLITGTLGVGGLITGTVSAGTLIVGTMAVSSVLVGTVAIGNYLTGQTLGARDLVEGNIDLWTNVIDWSKKWLWGGIIDWGVKSIWDFINVPGEPRDLGSGGNIVPGLQSGGMVTSSGVAEVHRGEIVADPDRLVSDLASAIESAGGGTTSGGRVEADMSGVESELKALRRDVKRLSRAMQSMRFEADGEQLGRFVSESGQEQVFDSNPLA